VKIFVMREAVRSLPSHQIQGTGYPFDATYFPYDYARGRHVHASGHEPG